MSKEKQCECCHEWWYGSDVKEDLCPNCYYYFKQLKQQLEEAQTRISELEDKDWYEANIKQLEEQNDKLIQERDKYKLQLEEKDKEIEILKRRVDRYENMFRSRAMKRTGNMQKDIEIYIKQLAIQELKRVKILLQNAINYEGYTFVGIYDAVNNQIRELRGE